MSGQDIVPSLNLANVETLLSAVSAVERLLLPASDKMRMAIACATKTNVEKNLGGIIDILVSNSAYNYFCVII